MKFVVLNENTVYQRGLRAEHGLSLYIETQTDRLLFDVGQSGIFMENARKLSINLDGIGGIILSHGHYDHCGGLACYASQYDLPPVYVGRGAFNRKYNQNREIGIPWEKVLLKDVMVENDGFLEINRNIVLLSSINAVNSFEGVDQGLTVERNGVKLPDSMQDEQMLVIREKEGLYVFLGCAHAGVLSALMRLRQVFPEDRIRLLFAGMHLLHADGERVDKTLAGLETFCIEKIMPAHCTGPAASYKMKEYFGSRCIPVCTGMVFCE